MKSEYEGASWLWVAPEWAEAALCPALVDRGGDDNADAESGKAHDDGEGGVPLLDEFLPQVIWGEEVDHEEGEAENDDAYDCVKD